MQKFLTGLLVLPFVMALVVGYISILPAPMTRSRRWLKTLI